MLLGVGGSYSGGHCLYILCCYCLWFVSILFDYTFFLSFLLVCCYGLLPFYGFVVACCCLCVLVFVSCLVFVVEVWRYGVLLLFGVCCVLLWLCVVC